MAAEGGDLVPDAPRQGGGLLCPDGGRRGGLFPDGNERAAHGTPKRHPPGAADVRAAHNGNVSSRTTAEGGDLVPDGP